MNLCIISGNVAKPTVRTTKTGKFVTNFTVCHTEKVQGQLGLEDKTDFINITAWGERNSQVQSGDFVFAEGSFKTDSWDDPNTGKKAYKSYVLAKTVKIIPKQQATQQSYQQHYQQQESYQQPAYQPNSVSNDDVPNYRAPQFQTIEEESDSIPF